MTVMDCDAFLQSKDYVIDALWCACGISGVYPTGVLAGGGAVTLFGISSLFSLLQGKD